MTTREAFFCSTRVAMWLMPLFTKSGFLAFVSAAFASFASAAACRRSFFCSLVSGRYLLRILNSSVAAVHKISLPLLHSQKGKFIKQVIFHVLTSVLVHRSGELVDSRRGLQALVQDSPLALQTHVLRPLHKSGHIALRLDAIADAKVLRPLLKESAFSILLCVSLLGTWSWRCRLCWSLGHFRQARGKSSKKTGRLTSGSMSGLSSRPPRRH